MIVVVVLCGISCAADSVEVRSPDERVRVSVRIDPADGAARYRVMFGEQVVVDDSPLGLTLQGGGAFGHLSQREIHRDAHDETYAIVAGKSSSARDHYNEVTVALSESVGGRAMEMDFRAYDDGVAFRYRIPVQDAIPSLAITSEETGFVLPPDAKAWVMAMPHNGGPYEYLYHPSKVAEIQSGQIIGCPLLIELAGSKAVAAITEADLNDYAGMALMSEEKLLRASLTALPGEKLARVKGALPHASPWRVVMVGESLGKLIESNIVSNLNPPCALSDTSWIHPGKVAFPWWNGYLVGDNGKRGGVDTATFNDYVDCAAEFGFPYSSIDGLDIAWYGGKIPGNGERDVTVPVPQVDMPKILAHAKAKGVRIRLWVAAVALRKNLDKALDTYERWGVEGIMVDFIDHDDQETMNWVREVVEKSARHHLTVTLHGISKPTGLSRTYPNLLTFEAVRNQEYDKWDPHGIPPEHNLTVPFARMLAGPLDYHMGAWRSVKQSEFLDRYMAPDVMGTRCHQIAMYVVYDNPMPMAVDYAGAYRHGQGVQLMSAIPTTWDETKYIDGAVGEFIAIARRKAATWYIGSMTSSNGRTVKAPLSFLGAGKFTAEIWSDDPAGGMNSLAQATRSVSSADTLSLDLAPAGGNVVVLKRGGE
jgi:alpha-glucosidase